LSNFTWQQKFLLNIVPFIGKLLIWFLGVTGRISGLNWDMEAEIKAKFGGYIYAFWHGRQIMLVYTHRNRGVQVLVSQSFDGELIARTINKFGIGTVRGSSTRSGKQALNQMIDLLNSNHIAAFTPDGPKGPAGTIAPGVIIAASKSGKPIIPLTFGAKRKIHLKSWDRFMIPLPFTDLVVMTGNPVMVPPNVRDEELNRYKDDLKNELDRITELSDHHFD